MSDCNEAIEIVSFEKDGFSIEYKGEIVKVSYLGDGEASQKIILPDGCELCYASMGAEDI